MMSLLVIKEAEDCLEILDKMTRKITCQSKSLFWAKAALHTFLRAILALGTCYCIFKGRFPDSQGSGFSSMSFGCSRIVILEK